VSPDPVDAFLDITVSILLIYMHICVKKATEALKYFVDNFQMLDLKCREHD